MADSKELQTQLQINQQINKVLAERSKQLDAMASQIGGQAKLAKELCKAMECKELEGLDERIDEITNSLNEASAAAEEAGANMAGMGSAAESAGKGGSGTLGDMLSAITPMKAAAVGAGTGFMKAFKGLPGMMGMVTGGLKSVVGGLFSVGKSILSIPFKILGGFVSAAAKTTGGVNELRQAMNDVKEEFGDLSTGAGKDIVTGFDNLRSSSGALAQSGLSITQVFGPGSGGAAAALKAVQEIASAAGPAMTMLGDQIAGAADKMVMMNKGLGMSNEALAEMARKAHNTGQDVGSQLVEMGSLAIQMGDKFGVSAKEIGKNMSALTEDVANFGNMSAKQLAATATYMAKLGLEAKDLQGVIGKFDDFKSAAGSVSELNQAFGIQLDTMEMMNAENPAERIDMMKDAFHEAGKSVEDMTRQEKALMAEQMGLSVSAMENVLAQENMGVAYEDMEAGAEEAEANKMSEKEVMLELAKSIKTLTQSGEGVDGFFDAFNKGFARGFAQNEEYKKSIQAIKASMKEFGKFGKEVGKVFADLMQHLGLFEAVQKIFDPKAFKGLLDKILGYFKKFADSTKSGGQYSFGDMVKDIFEEVKSYLSPGGAGGEGASAFGDFFENAIRFAGDAIASALPFIVEKIAEFITFVAEVIKDPSRLKEIGGGAQEGIGGAFADSFSKIGEALAPVLPQLFDAFKLLFEALYEKIKPVLIFGLKRVILFAVVKALVSALATAAANALVMKAVSVFTKGFGKSMGEGLDKNATKSMGKGGGGFFDSLGNMLESIGKINPGTVAKAGLNLAILAASFMVSLAIFAAGVLVTYKILEKVPFEGILKVFGMLALSMLAMIPFVIAALLMEPATITTAGLMMLVGATFFAISVIAFAAAIRVAYEVLAPVPFVEFAAMMGMLGIAILATIGLAAVGVAFGTLIPLVPLMIVGMVVAAGLFTAGVVIFAKAIEKSLPTFKKMASNQSTIEFSIQAIIDVLKAVGMMSVLGAVFAPLFFFYKILVKGFEVAAKFFVKASKSMEKMIKAIMKIPMSNPDEVKKRVEIVMLVAKAMEAMAAIGLDAAKLGAVTEMAGGTTIPELFESMGGFIETIGQTLGNLVMMIVMMAAGLDESQMEGVKVVATVIDAVASLAGALFSPLEAVSKMSSGMFGPSVTEVMSAVVGGLQQLMASIIVFLPLLVAQLISIASGISDPCGLKPKMDVVATSLKAVSDFATAIGAVADLMPEEGGGFFSKGKTMGERLNEMGAIISKVVESVKIHIGPLVRSITKIDIGGDAEKVKAKVEVVGLAIRAVADFANTVQKLASLNMEASDVTNTIASLSEGVYNSVSMDVSHYNLNEVFKGLKTFTGDEGLLEKFDLANTTMQKLMSFAKTAQQLATQYDSEEFNAHVAIAKMVEEAQLAVTALNGVGELNVTAALDNFAQAIGTGSGEFNITNEPVQITMNVQVTMDANSVGKVLVDKSVMTTALATAEG